MAKVFSRLPFSLLSQSLCVLQSEHERDCQTKKECFTFINYTQSSCFRSKLEEEVGKSFFHVHAFLLFSAFGKNCIMYKADISSEISATDCRGRRRLLSNWMACWDFSTFRPLTHKEETQAINRQGQVWNLIFRSVIYVRWDGRFENSVLMSEHLTAFTNLDTRELKLSHFTDFMQTSKESLSFHQLFRLCGEKIFNVAS